MAMTHEELFRKLYYRQNGEGRKLCKCAHCGEGPASVLEEVVSSDPCYECGEAAWRELTEEEFASESILIDLLT
jgi:hypothetical protein